MLLSVNKGREDMHENPVKHVWKWGHLISLLYWCVETLPLGYVHYLVHFLPYKEIPVECSGTLRFTCETASYMGSIIIYSHDSKYIIKVSLCGWTIWKKKEHEEINPIPK